MMYFPVMKFTTADHLYPSATPSFPATLAEVKTIENEARPRL